MKRVKILAAGKLRSRIRLEKRSDAVQDGYGNSDNAGEWETVTEVAASILPLKGNEKNIADHQESQVRHKIKIRGGKLVKDVTGGWRAVNARTGEVFNIKYPANHDMRNRYIFLYCTMNEAS